MRSLIMALALALTAPAAMAAGQIEEVSTELQATEAIAYPGSEYRDVITQAARLSQQGRVDAAWNVLQPAILYCDDKKSSAAEVFYSVANKAEEQEYRDSTPAGVKLHFVDWACPMAYKSAAFLAVQTNEPDRAGALLDRAQALAPHWAEPLAERAYMIGKFGDRPGSLAMYRKAQVLADKYPSSANLKGLILRGIGFALTEMGDLDGATDAYKRSLEIEPSNALAKRELEYIEGVRAEKRQGGK